MCNMINIVDRLCVEIRGEFRENEVIRSLQWIFFLTKRKHGDARLEVHHPVARGNVHIFVNPKIKQRILNIKITTFSALIYFHSNDLTRDQRNFRCILDEE